jgi:hypothetical protein
MPPKLDLEVDAVIELEIDHWIEKKQREEQLELIEEEL